MKEIFLSINFVSFRELCIMIDNVVRSRILMIGGSKYCHYFLLFLFGLACTDNSGRYCAISPCLLRNGHSDIRHTLHVGFIADMQSDVPVKSRERTLLLQLTRGSVRFCTNLM